MKKFTYIILITFISICSIMMTGCGGSLQDLTLHFSDESIELNLEEEKSYTIEVGNVGKEQPKFHFGFDKKIATVVGDPLDLGNGKYKINIKGLMASSTTLTITLLQNNKSIEIPVKVYENIESFSLKNNKPIYILRGDSYKFSEELFNFYPETNQKELIFSANSEVLVNGVLQTNEDTPNLLQVNAKSIYKESLSVDIDVYVLDKIDDKALKDVKLYLGEKVLTPIGTNKNGEDIGDVIEIIANDKNEYIKNLKLVYDSRYNYQFLSKDDNISVEPSEDSTFENVKFINVQYKSKGLKDTFIVRISHKNFDSYYVDLTYHVTIKLIPKSLNLNGEFKELPIKLFDNADDETSVNILTTVEPLKSTYEAVKLVFFGVKEIKLPNGSVNLDEKELNYDDIKNYICIKYRNLEITDNVLNDLSYPINIKGKNVLGGVYDYIRIRVMCESSLLENPIYNDIKITIYKSATDFYIDDEVYKDSTLYVKNGTEVEFSDFTIVENDAYIGKIIAVPDYLSTGFVEVKQKEENSKTIIIKALKPGQATYTLYLSSGLSTKIKIVVKDEVKIDDFMLYISGNTQKGIAQVEYRKVGNTDTLSKVAVRGKNVEFSVSYNVLPKNIDPDMYECVFDSKNTDNIVVEGKTIKAIEYSDIPTLIGVTLKYYVIEDFQKVLKNSEDLNQDRYNYNFEVVCFKPLSSFNLLGLNKGVLDAVSMPRVDAYDGTGFVDKALSHVRLSLWVDGQEVTTDKVNNLKWSFSVEVSDPFTDEYGEYVELSKYGGSVILGKFYKDKLEFVCSGRDNIGESVLITAQIEEHGKIWASTMQIYIKKYEQVTNIWLSNYKDTIYLDAIHNSEILYPYIVPTSATNKNFLVQFIPDVDTSSSIISILYDLTYISIKYSGKDGGGGLLKIIPNSKFINDNEYTYSLDIRVEIGDGAKEHPLRINSLEEFKKIDVEKYYIIQSMIDAKGETLKPFPTLKGGIKGENGGIKNFVISEPLTVEGSRYYGLFSNIDVNAELKDLNFTGSFNIKNKDENKINNIGLLCGINKGTIENVNVTYVKTEKIIGEDIEISANNDNNIGIICGQNEGNILIDSTTKNIKSTLIVYMPEEEVLGVKLDNKSTFKPYSLGGVTGINKGTIAFNYNGVFNKYNYYGTNVVVNMHVYVTNNNPSIPENISFVGGVCGQNEGDVLRLQVCGNINRHLDYLFLQNTADTDPSLDITTHYQPSKVGGLIGYNLKGNVTENISRVFVSGENMVGGLIGLVNQGNIKNNKVQAVDDAKKMGLNASMIVYYGTTGYDAIANNFANSGNTNTSESYFYRILIKDNFSAMDTTNFYGDVVYVQAKDKYVGKTFDRAADAEDKLLANMYNRTGKYKNETIVLNYYQAKNPENQYYLSELNTTSLPNDLFIDIMELSMVSSNPSILTVGHNGELIVQKTGEVTLTITSVLKADDKLNLKVYITNYINGLELYRTSSRDGDPIKSLDVIEISNSNSYNLYPKYTASVEVGNTIIELVENQEAKINIKTLNIVDGKENVVTDEDSVIEKYVSINKFGNVITFKGLGKGVPTSILDLGYYVYIELKGNDYRYLINTVNGFEYTAVNGKDTLSVQGINSTYKIKMNYKQGIYKINTDKDNIIVAPIDVINLRVEYYTYDSTDPLGFNIYYEDNNDYLEGNLAISKYFKVDQKPLVIDGNKIYVDYAISMDINKVRLGDYRFIFYGADKSVYKSINVTYITQPINNIILNNYTEIDNKNNIRFELPKEDGKPQEYLYNTSYTMQETNTMTAGETNLLRINIEPMFSTYDYVEVSNDQFNIDKGKIVMFSLLEQYYSKDHIEGTLGDDEKDRAVVSSNSYYIPNGIRIYREAIKNGQIMILYSLSTNIIEGEEIKININFFNNSGISIYPTQQKTVEVAVNKSIKVKVAGRDKYLARGRRYVLDVKTYGYNDNEIFISTNSPYVKIERDIDGTYYLQISNQVSYGVGEGAAFSISYYGERIVNGLKVRSSQGSIEYIIVEYVADSLNIQDMFKDDRIILNVNDKTDDIRDKIIDRVHLEYANDAVTAVNQLKATLKTSATYFYKLSKDTKFEQLISGKDGVEDTAVSNKYVDIKGYTVTPKFVGEDTFFLGLYAELEYYSGYLRVVTLDENFDFTQVEKKSFRVIANQRTSEDNEMPIKTYKEFINISEGNSYILMNDIFIESDYIPLNVNFRSLDGNGYSIIFKGAYKNTDMMYYGIFQKIYEDSIVKNIKIVVDENSTAIFNFDNTNLASGLTFGLLASENYGVVYNCSVEMFNETSSIKVSNTSSVMYTAGSYVAALVGVNYGYITHSRVSAKIECNGANLAGLVGVNNGHISSSYVKKSLIENISTDVNNSTGGLCVSNNKNIFASFVEGNYRSNIKSMYADDLRYIVRASSIASAFVYNNVGIIDSCYANIPIISSSRNSGFVCINEGLIKNSYTTSRLGDKDTANYPFFISNSNKNKEGIIQDCYFLSDNQFNVNVNKSNDNLPEDMLRKATIMEFATAHKTDENNAEKRKILPDKLFTTFVRNKNKDSDAGVWFYPYNPDFDDKFVVGATITSKEYNEYIANVRTIYSDKYMYRGRPQGFVGNRPQLVAANMLAYSQRHIIKEEYKEETGETLYKYSTDNLGSALNPYIVTTARQLEDTVLDNSYMNIFEGYIRVVKDLDYQEEAIVVSKLFKIVMEGYIEGNELTISGFSLNNNESLLSSGFFSQIGDGTKYAVLQNLTMAPKYINLPNAYNVGAVAGTVYKANVYNIFVDGYKNQKDGLVIMGRDIVGGVFGRTMYDYDINTVKSSVSVNAYITCNELDWTSPSAQERILYDELKGNIATIAYSGCVVGYLGGLGYIRNITTVEDVAAIGMVSGLIFGGIGLDAHAENIDYTPTYGENNFIRASVYGGIIVGDSKGTLRNVIIHKNEEIKDGILFRNVPIIPQAIGGVVGIQRGGKLENAEVNVSIISDNLTYVVGGIIGKVVQNASLYECLYKGDTLNSKQILGGIIGELNTTVSQDISVNIINCSVGNESDSENTYTTMMVEKLASDVDTEHVYMGGVIGVLTGYDANELDENKKFDQNVKISGLILKANTVIDMSMYGQNMDNAVETTNYSISVANLVGGFISDEFYEECATFWCGGDGNAKDCRIIMDNVNSSRTSIIDLLWDVKCQNLINGNIEGNDNLKGYEIPKGYVIRFGEVIIKSAKGIDADQGTQENQLVTASYVFKINGTIVNMGDNNCIEIPTDLKPSN